MPVPLTDICNRTYQRSAPAPAVQEHHLCRRAGVAARHRARSRRSRHRRAVRRQGEADRAEREGVPPRLRLRRRASGRRLRAQRRQERQGGRPHLHRRQRRGGAGLRLWRRDGCGLVSDHAVHLAGRSLRRALQEIPRRSRDRQEQIRHRAGGRRDRRHRHGDRRRLERRARLHRDVRARHLADAGILRPRLFRGNSGRRLRHPARRPFDRHADAHAAIRRPDRGLCEPWRHQARAAVPGGPGRSRSNSRPKPSISPSGCRRPSS